MIPPALDDAQATCFSSLLYIMHIPGTCTTTTLSAAFICPIISVLYFFDHVSKQTDCISLINNNNKQLILVWICTAYIHHHACAGFSSSKCSQKQVKHTWWPILLITAKDAYSCMHLVLRMWHPKKLKMMEFYTRIDVLSVR